MSHLARYLSAKVLKTFPGAGKYLKTLVSFGKVTAEQKEVADGFGLVIYSWDDFLQLDIKLLMNDIKELKPTVLCAVPRVLDRIYSGDIGEWQPDGSMKIIDRKKNIFKLSQGECVSVEKLESIYSLVSSIDSIWVYGNSFESFLVAVANPNKEFLERWGEENGVLGDFSTICDSQKAKAYILGELVKIGKEKKLKGFELIKAVYLDPIPFDMDRDLLTPTFKKKRAQFLKYYQVCWSSLLWRRLNWEATNLRSSAIRAKATTSVRACAVLVEVGRMEEELGSKAHCASHDKQHLIDRISLTDYGALLGVKYWFETIAHAIQQLPIHFLKHRNTNTGDTKRRLKAKCTDSLKQSPAKMALYVPPEVLRKVTYERFFLHTSGFLPSVLLIPPYLLPQILREHTVRHPLFSISPFYSHLFYSDSDGLQIFLRINRKQVLKYFSLLVPDQKS
ncbi:hypothetical protein RJ640_003971 [Escallonia rubra]|uniref:Uncharacterized protein n=1 Tax=Escallonia rubra TaxID=112253 RepID=A0AA88RPU2_9ASTE|nr:hypothetical protein RJ640_003971 [Escallonia rubra]